MDVLGAALLGACGAPQAGGGPAPGVEFEVRPASAAPGGRVELVLTNGSPGTLGYNLCNSGLERRHGGGWEAVPSDRVCTRELRTLPPGEQARYPLDLPTGLAPDEYRFLTTLEDMAAGTRDGVASEPFRVGG